MSFIRKVVQKRKNGVTKIYYAEVESIREGKKVIQKYIRSLGDDPKHPLNFPIEPVHFSYIAIQLMKGTLTPNDVFEMLENMGERVRKESLGRIGIYYDFGKKTFSIYLFYQKKLKGKGKENLRITKRDTKYKR